ncbi:MAG: BatA domain-containing protein [Planctomycetota bacterium]
MIFESPLGLLALSVIPIIVLFHRFRQRPRRQNISSLFIWKQIEHYLTSNPLKNKKSLYLIVLLQILTVVFLSFALAKPIWKITESQPPRFVFLIDNSASMGSIYNDSSQKHITRWELLLNRIKKVIEEAPTKSIFYFYQTYQKEPLINLSRSKALNIIKTLTLTEIPSDVESLIPVIKDIDCPIYFCSDQLPSEKLLGYFRQKPHLILVGQPSNNKAIIRVSASPIPNRGNYYDVFVSIRDYSRNLANETKIPIELIGLTKEGEKILGHQEVTMKKSEDIGIFFRDIYLPEKHPLKIRLNIDDGMMCDNSVWLMPSQKDKINIALIGKNSPVLLKALRAIPYVLVEYFPANDDSSKNDKYDICMFNEIVPLNLPQKAVVISGISDIVTEKHTFWKYEGKVSNPVIRRIETSSPILNYCVQDIFTGIPWAVRLTPTEKEYLKPIIQGKSSIGEDIILLCEWQKGAQHLVMLNFMIEWVSETNPSDWTTTPSFPIFWTNLINYLNLGGQSLQKDYLLYRTNELIDGNIFLRAGWYYSGNNNLLPEGIGINLCNDKESDNNGISVMDTAKPSASKTLKKEIKRIDFANGSIFIAGILLLLSWILGRTSF